MKSPTKSKELNHLGIVAGMIDKLEIVSAIDSRVKQDTTDRHISIGVGLSVYLFHLFLPKLKSKLTSHSLLLTISGLYTFVSFGLAASLIEGFVLSPQTNLEIESLMEFNVLSFGLMVCFIIMMLLIFKSNQFL